MNTAATADHRIFRGWIYHHRSQPEGHSFRYPAFFTSFNTAALASGAGTRLFKYNRKALFSLRDVDYLDRPDEPLAAKESRLFDQPGVTRVELVTVPRVFGYAFNPVSFHLGYDRDDHLVAMLAEVNNTFKERHLYRLTDPVRNEGGFVHFQTAKAFHVSPFNDRMGEYRFRVKRDAEGLEIHVDIAREGSVVFRSGIVAPTSSPLSDRGLLAALVRYPLQNLLTIPRIHWQAAQLYFRKKVRYFPKPAPDSPMTLHRAPPTAIEKLGRRVFEGLLGNLSAGGLSVTTPDGVTRNYGPGGSPAADLHITDHTFYRRILLDGDIGLGEAYMYGQWTTSDLTGFIAYLIANRDALENGEIASSRLKWLVNRIAHLLRSNNRSNSRRNITAHYDLSNEFFQTFLDPTMLYSCGVYLDEGDTLEQAQHNKMRLLIERAGIQPGDHVLEIGSGWGGMAIEMATTTGCRVTSITISQEQLKLARERVKAAGLDDRVTIEFCDYRDVRGQFDRVVSIEMLEAVGHEHFDDYFRAIDRALKPGGRAAIQVITIPHARYDAYRNSVDWIQKHIFPGGHLPSVKALEASMVRVSPLRVAEQHDIGPHYARTLRQWSENLAAARDRLTAMGFDDVFYRTWQYYFSYCEAAFATRTLGNHHLVLAR